MYVLDRYLLRQFVQVYLICFISLTGLYLVIDAFANLDNFVEHARHQGGLGELLVRYYAYRSIAFFDRTSGVLCLIAAVFTLTWFQRYNEMTALLAAGISRVRVLVPVLMAVIMIALISAAGREWVMPRIRHELARDSKNLDGGQTMPIESRYDSDTDLLLDGAEAVLATRTIVQPNFALPEPLQRYGRYLVAAIATYLPAEGQRPAGYLLKGVTEPASLAGKPSLVLEDKRVVYFPGDTSGLAPDEVFVASRVPLDLLTNSGNWRDFASTGELVRELRSPSVDLGNDVRVSVHRRVLQPLMDATLVMLGLPLVVARTNRNPFIAIGLCVTVVAAFFVISLSCQSLGVSGWLSPSLAAWLPLIIFVPVAATLVDGMRR